MPAMVMLRAGRESDIPAITQCLPQGVAYTGDVATLRAHLEAALDGQVAVVVAVDHDDTLLGAAVLRLCETGGPLAEPGTLFASADTPEGDRELVAVWVREDYRRRGLARAMLSKFTPLWATSVITATVPAGAEVEPVDRLLRSFAFTRSAETGDGPARYRCRRVRRTTGRANTVPLRN